MTEKRSEAFKELQPTLDQYAGVKGSLITILQKAQEIYGVATFYAQFRLEPIGKYLLMMCQGTACHVNGSESIYETVSEELGIVDGETTGDNVFTINNVACLGCCSLAPVMMVRSSDGDETYGNLTKDSVRAILKEIAARG